MEKTDSTLRHNVEELLLCKCGDVDHQCIIAYDPDEKDPEVFLSIHLVREYNFFKRVGCALRYIFGKRSIYGDFDEILLRPIDAPKLRKVVEYLEKETD